MSFSYYCVVSDPQTEEAIQLGENQYIVKRELDDDESNGELKAKLKAQAGRWKLVYKIAIDRFNYYLHSDKTVLLKPENVVVDGTTLIGFVFHEQYFDLSQADKSVAPEYVPPDFLDVGPCYDVFAQSVTLTPTESFC